MFVRKSAIFATSAALALGIGACGGEEEATSSATPAAENTQNAAATPEPVAQINELTGRDTAVALDPGFLEALESLNVTPGAVGDGEITEGGEAVFPITGGNVTYYEPGTVSPYVQGMIEHDGSGLSLEAGGKNVELTDFVIDPGKSVLNGKVTVDGEVAAESAPLFFLDGRTLEPLKLDQEEGTAVLEGTTVSLTREAADLLNEAFGTDALTEFLLVGTATITLALDGPEATSSPSPTATTETETETETQTESQTESQTETETEVVPDGETAETTAPEPTPAG